MPVEIKNIKSIQVFSAVSEVQNVTRAAQLLYISQSSVSYHIKKLEADLGTILFRRTAAGLELTDAGAVLAEHVARGLSTIRAGLDQVVDQVGTVQVALLPMFASRWLSSRLGSLMENHPDLHLSIKNHNNSYAHLPNPKGFADLGIHWGRGNWPNFDVRKLWSERLMLVCSPKYLETRPIHTPADLQSCTLLHVDDTRMWEEWFALNDLPLPATQPQMMLEDRHFQLSSTINGLGVSLFASWAVKSELESGELVDPFGRTFDTSFAYHMITPRDVELSPAAQLFRDWLFDVADSDREFS